VNDESLTDALRQFVGSPAHEFLLHREPILLVDTLLDIGADFARCEWLAEAPEFEEAERGIPAYIGIETMAQCIAVHAGARARVRGFGPPLGFLLGTRHFSSSVSHLVPGRTYVAECRELVRDSQGMGSFACQLLLDGESVATANLAVLEQPQG
jgi:predicted hotdog family 3-hydroxylacyl-ACP dehydratase